MKTCFKKKQAVCLLAIWVNTRNQVVFPGKNKIGYLMTLGIKMKIHLWNPPYISSTRPMLIIENLPTPVCLFFPKLHCIEKKWECSFITLQKLRNLFTFCVMCRVSSQPQEVGAFFLIVVLTLWFHSTVQILPWLLHRQFMMGSRVGRMLRNFNLESRAHREIGKEKPVPAPRHPTPVNTPATAEGTFYGLI